jgi:hypothetical protein
MSPLNYLNPSAGDVALPSEKLEVEAAVRASAVSWRICPYYALRYQARGEAYSRSDSAWLVTLTEADQGYVNQQVLWLGGLLSNRGMPRLLLEKHLIVLYRQLVRVAPDKAVSFEKLCEAAGELGHARSRYVSDGELDALSMEFAIGLGCESNRLIRQAGALVAAAVADEKAGIKHAVSRLKGWLIEPARFEDLASLPRCLKRHRAFFSEIEKVRSSWEAAVLNIVQEARDLRS